MLLDATNEVELIDEVENKFNSKIALLN